MLWPWAAWLLFPFYSVVRIHLLQAFILPFPILIAGIVCSSRLILGAHNRFEMISGFLIGFLAQSIGWIF